MEHLRYLSPHVRFELQSQLISRTYLEASEIWDVKEWHLIDVELEMAFACVGAEGSVTQSLGLLNFQPTLVALLLQTLAFRQGHRVRVLVLAVLRQLE